MVQEWFDDFVKHLCGSLVRADWPDNDSPFWKYLKSALVRCGATEDVAREAVGLVVESPPPFLDRLIPGLVESIKQVHESHRSMIGDVPSDRAAAEALSRGCEECGGSGMTSRRAMVRPRADRPAFEASIGLICHKCAAGRWIARRQSEDPPKDGRKIPDLADHPRLWPDEFKYAPAPEKPRTEAEKPRTEAEAAR